MEYILYKKYSATTGRKQKYNVVNVSDNIAMLWQQIWNESDEDWIEQEILADKMKKVKDYYSYDMGDFYFVIEPFNLTIDRHELVKTIQTNSPWCQDSVDLVLQNLPGHIAPLFDKLEGCEDEYETLEVIAKELKEHGWYMDYYVDGSITKLYKL